MKLAVCAALVGVLLLAGSMGTKLLSRSVVYGVLALCASSVSITALLKVSGGSHGPGFEGIATVVGMLSILGLLGGALTIYYGLRDLRAGGR